jgi:hypothetical protein
MNAVECGMHNIFHLELESFKFEILGILRGASSSFTFGKFVKRF